MANHLVLKGSTWHVRLDIPADVRLHESFFMKKVMTKSLKTGDKKIAKTASLKILSDWKKQIEAIRAGKLVKSWISEAENYREEFIQKISGVRQSMEYQKIISERNAEIDRIGLRHGLTSVELEEVRQLIRGTAKPKHPISPALIDQFEEHQKKYNVIEKTASVQASNIRKYAKFLEENELSMNHESFAAYLQAQKLAYKTLQNRIFAGTSFWKYLIQVQPKLRKEENPFENHILPKPKKGEPVSESYAAFEVHEVEKLYHAAKSLGDEVLATTIKIGAYTGFRIEEICKLKTSDIKDNVIHITKAKTKAGIRSIPIPATLKTTISELSKNSKDGYLINSSAGNKYNVRSDSISKRFGRLKKSMGYSRTHVFHSIRKTAATQLEQAGINPLTIMIMMGHSRKTVTFDIYAKGPTNEQKLAALNCIKYNF